MIVVTHFWFFFETQPPSPGVLGFCSPRTREPRTRSHFRSSLLPLRPLILGNQNQPTSPQLPISGLPHNQSRPISTSISLTRSPLSIFPPQTDHHRSHSSSKSVLSSPVQPQQSSPSFSTQSFPLSSLFFSFDLLNSDSHRSRDRPHLFPLHRPQRTIFHQHRRGKASFIDANQPPPNAAAPPLSSSSPSTRPQTRGPPPCYQLSEAKEKKWTKKDQLNRRSEKQRKQRNRSEKQKSKRLKPTVCGVVLCFAGHRWRGRQEGRKLLQISPVDLIF